MCGVKYIVNSSNRKLAGFNKIDATYVSIESTCPKNCPLKSEGCYAELFPMSIHVKQLDVEAEELSALQVARAEAKLINESYDGGEVPFGRSLRLHVSGDCRTMSGARTINRAVGSWQARGGGVAFSYTHCWDHVTKDLWSNVSMLASVDSVKDVKYARQNGYAPAIVVVEHLSERAYFLLGSDVKWISCPAQTRGVSCSDCKICFDANRLFHNNMGVSFAIHGVRKGKIKRRLNLIK